MALLLQQSWRLQDLLNRPISDPFVLASALAIAFFLGAAHALTPGHGKTIVAAYLVGTRGRITDAVFLGSVVTATHTMSVFVLGVATLYASQRVALDRIYPWLTLVSGLLVTGIGGWLFWRRLRGDHGHHHHHDHHHDRHHTRDPDHHHEHPHVHERPGRGSLLSLGVSGGLVPCPEALVVLMISISLRKLGLGLVLLAAFTLGLAAILIAIGVAMVLAGPLMQRFTGENRVIRALPVASAAVVTVLGLVIVAQASRSLSA